MLNVNSRSHPLRAATAAAVLLALGGCAGGTMSTDQARTASVADFPGGSLKGATLERWLLKLPQAPSALTASQLLSSWINTALAVQAVRDKQPLDDSATTDAVIAPDADRGIAQQYFARRDSARPPVTDRQLDSLQDVDRTRVFQQIVVRIAQTADSATAAAAIERARSLLKRARDGANFGALSVEASPDSITRATQGYLPAITREQLGRLPQAMQTIWTLRPGAISAMIPSPIGIHIMRRATRDEARPGLKRYLAPILAQRSDSLFIDSIARAHHIQLAPAVAVRVRALALEPVTVTDSSPLATWQGGALSPAQVRTATLMIDPANRVQMANASDSAISNYVRELATRFVLLSAIAPGPRPTAAARAALSPPYHVAVESLHATLGRIPTSLGAGEAATQIIDSVIAGHQKLPPLPGALSDVLRSTSKVRVDQTALASVLRVATDEWRLQHANDTTSTTRK